MARIQSMYLSLDQVKQRSFWLLTLAFAVMTGVRVAAIVISSGMLMLSERQHALVQSHLLGQFLESPWAPCKAPKSMLFMLFLQSASYLGRLARRPRALNKFAGSTIHHTSDRGFTSIPQIREHSIGRSIP